jgi:hypothetical protein
VSGHRDDAVARRCAVAVATLGIPRVLTIDVVLTVDRPEEPLL